MSIANEQQFAMDQLVETNDDSKKKPRVSYTRKFLLSLSDKDVCKKLPNLPTEFNDLFLRDSEDPSPERLRIYGDFSSHGLRRNDYSSSPPTRGELGGNSRGFHGRWEGRSGGWNDKDSDSHSDRDPGSSMSGSNSSNVRGSTRRGSGRFNGVPKKCWCGEQMMNLMSNSDNNPYRRYFRCSYAAAQKLVNDAHIFKWVDEALLNEYETLQIKNGKLEQEMKEMARDCEAFEKLVFEKVLNKLEKEIFERVEEALDEANREMKKMMIGMVFGCLMLVGIMAFVL